MNKLLIFQFVIAVVFTSLVLSLALMAYCHS